MESMIFLLTASSSGDSPKSTGSHSAGGSGQSTPGNRGTSNSTGAGNASGLPLASEEECARLRLALLTSQDAAVAHLLLELCLPSLEEEVFRIASAGFYLTEIYLAKIRFIQCTRRYTNLENRVD